MAEELPPVTPREFAYGKSYRARHPDTYRRAYTDPTEEGQDYRAKVDVVRMGDRAKARADKRMPKSRSRRRSGKSR